MWERGEHGAPGGDQPDLIAVPYRTDRVEDGTPSTVVTAAERMHEHPDAEVEALQYQEAEE
ncbi:Uncharacterised protein [Mycobacteroides abscessus subsp. abscessus]|nr:Uncharacterised protein [Mycobacteroides abscessus subsp. abscessus]SKU96985.1 Uncharacterised protein [Mycobacteroides abscessus subsp. abscessus]